MVLKPSVLWVPVMVGEWQAGEGVTNNLGSEVC